MQVEVCKVKAKEFSASDQKRLGHNARKRRASMSVISSNQAKQENGRGEVGHYEREVTTGPDEEEDGGGEGDEWRYESGDEGKPEGHWQKGGKRMKVG